MNDNYKDHVELDQRYHLQIYRDYDRVTNEPRVIASRRLFRPLLSKIQPGLRVLDLGGGTGHMLERLRGRFQHYIGVDHSDRMLEVARSRSTQGYESVEFIQADVVDWMINSSDQFDCISCVGFLHHLPHAKIEELFSHLPGRMSAQGALLVAEPIDTESGPPNLIQRWNEKSLVAKSIADTPYAHAEEPDEAPLPLDWLTGTIVDSGFSVLGSNRGWEVFHHHEPPTFSDKLIIPLLDMMYGRQGNILALVAEPRSNG